jgi:hypothetical protein
LLFKSLFAILSLSTLKAKSDFLKIAFRSKFLKIQAIFKNRFSLKIFKNSSDF